MQHFKVTNYEIIGNFISVIITKYHIEIPIRIPTDKFEHFLKIEDKLDWELNTTDHTGEHLQFLGTMSLDEYWNTNKKYILVDLYDYITKNPITFRGQVFTDSVRNLCLTFDLCNAKRKHPEFVK